MQVFDDPDSSDYYNALKVCHGCRDLITMSDSVSVRLSFVMCGSCDASTILTELILASTGCPFIQLSADSRTSPLTLLSGKNVSRLLHCQS